MIEEQENGLDFDIEGLSNEEITERLTEEKQPIIEGDDNLFTDTDIADLYKEKAGENVSKDFFKNEKGEFLTKKEALEKVISNFQNTVEVNKSDDEFVRNYFDAKEKGISSEEFVKNLSKSKEISEMPTKEYLKVKLKEDGLEEKDILEFLESENLVKLDIMAKEYKAKDINKLSEASIQANKKALNEVIETNKASNIKAKNAITTYFTEANKAGKSILKFSDDELKEIIDGAVDLMSLKVIRTENGLVNSQGINEVLNNDEMLFELLPFITMAKANKLKPFLQKFKSEIKDREFNKLDRENAMPGTGSSGNSGNYMADFFNGK